MSVDTMAARDEALLEAAAALESLAAKGDSVRDDLHASGMSETAANITGNSAIIRYCADTVRKLVGDPPAPSDLVIDTNGRPNFSAMVRALHGEAKWILEIHSGDKTGQAQSDAVAVLRLAHEIGIVARRLGFDCEAP